MHNHEGGIRVNAFVSGGLIPAQYPHMVGTKLDGLTSIAVSFHTLFCSPTQDSNLFLW